jgi:predicted  nucleic acid-binding Zn-ribbon protein
LENKLRTLYQLQLIDNSLDELEELKGDLPRETRELEMKVSQLQDHIASLEQTMREAFGARDTADNEIVTLRGKLERYKKQQLEVRNNREYDALSREMDTATESVTRLEKEMEALEGRATIARTDIEATRPKLEEGLKLLEEKRMSLAEVSRSTETEEQKYRHEREKTAKRISPEDLMTYERIRKAKKGKAVVPVKRGACGGCYNKVPPQKLLELRVNAKVFTCEQCGRILVSDEIVGHTTPVSS